MKACPRCGAKHIDSAVVCLKCGAVMGNVPGSGQAQGTAGTSQQVRGNGAAQGTAGTSQQVLGNGAAQGTAGTSQQVRGNGAAQSAAGMNRQARGNGAAQSAAGNLVGQQSAQPGFRHVSGQPTYSAVDLGKMQQSQTNGQYGAGSSQVNSQYGNRAAHMNNQYGGGTSQRAPGASGKGLRTAQKKPQHTSAVGPGPKERRGRRAFLIGMIVMGIYTLINAVFMLMNPGYPYGIGYMIGYWLVSAFVGGAYGFGFAFGMDYVKRWTKAGAWSAGKIGLWAWFLKVLRGEEHISLLTFPLIGISLAVGVAFGWIPGIPKGIREIRKERRQRSQGSI